MPLTRLLGIRSNFLLSQSGSTNPHRHLKFLNQVKNEKSSLELQMEACKAEIKMVDMERPLQQVDDDYHDEEDDYHGEDNNDDDDDEDDDEGARG